MTTKRVLVVDDDPGTRQMLRTLLMVEGYAVELADDGEAAVARMRAAPADVILLDIMLPGMDGHEVARALRGHPAFARIPIIFLTARREVEDRALAATEGGLTVLRKPFPCRDLLDAVRGAVGGEKPAA